MPRETQKAADTRASGPTRKSLATPYFAYALSSA